MPERRFVQAAEIRSEENGHIQGHAAVFNQEYVLCDYPDFRVVETIKPRAFARAITEKQDVRGLFNHDPSLVIGRTTAGTLELKEDQTGLWYDCDPPDTQLGRDLRTLIKRKDVTGCSFGFSVRKQTRTEEEVDGKITIRRAIEDVDLYDVSPVTFPAYEGTDVTARAAEMRSIFPEGVPEKLLESHPELRVSERDDDEDEIGCECDCEACSDCSKRSKSPASQTAERNAAPGLTHEHARARAKTLLAEMSQIQ